jgi:peptide deformylase
MNIVTHPLLSAIVLFNDDASCLSATDTLQVLYTEIVTAMVNGNKENKEPTSFSADCSVEDPEEYKGTVRPVVQMGDPLLTNRSAAVDVALIGSETIQRLVADLKATMLAAPGIGISAPQIGELLRIVVFYVPDGANKTGVPLTVLINPEIETLGDELSKDFEGCLSVEGKRGKVIRHGKIRYTGLDAAGDRVDGLADGWHARIVQHEVDHLNGVLYPTRMQEEDELMDGWMNPLLEASLSAEKNGEKLQEIAPAKRISSSQ